MGKLLITLYLYCGTGYLRHTVYADAFIAHFRSEYRRYKSGNEQLKSSLKHHGYHSSSGFECRLNYTEVPAVSESKPDSEISENPETSEGTCECGKKYTGESAGRIVGGDEASMHEYPYQCMLKYYKSDYQFCGCSLINEFYVLTASHCVVNEDTGEVINPEEIIVSLGDHQKNTPDETDKTVHMRVTSIISHEDYDSEKTENDIAVLKLEKPVEMNGVISPVCLPFKEEGMVKSGITGTVTGWGVTSSGGEDSKMLLEVNLPVLTTEDCQDMLGPYVTDNMICTYEEGKDACQGDSGGPLVSYLYNNNSRLYQIGIVSWGIGCGEKNYPGVYTFVEKYLDWIIRNTDGKFCKK
ncbi:Trypsin-1 [Armadillidium nasatum]|uniref:Trypsin-1 n=1 Tax=Armadillidium nasatum TaxID=96803 RepID=A0A5N5T1J8_9CRUS|nr:Trypsin-1 [Armadillidium nasatum]